MQELLMRGLFDGDYNSLTNLPTLFDGQFSSLTGKPTTLAGYGITDGVSTSNVNAIVTQQVAAQTSAMCHVSNLIWMMKFMIENKPT